MIQKAPISGSSVIAALLVAVVVVGSVPGTAAAQDDSVYLHISDVSVSNKSPTVGETVTFEITIEASGNSDKGIRLQYLTLYESGKRLSYTEDIGTVAPGDSIKIEQQATFREPGTKEVHVEGGATYQNEFGGQVIRNVATVDVTEPERGRQPRIDIETSNMNGSSVQIGPDRVVENTVTNVSVTVSNPNETPISDLEVTLTSSNSTIETQRKVKPELGGMSASKFQFNPVFSSPGYAELQATLSYDGGEVVTNQSLRVEPMKTDISLYTETSGGELNTTIANLGNTVIRNVVVEGYGQSRPVSFGRIGPGGAVTKSLDTKNVTGFMISAHYKAGVVNEVVHENVSMNDSTRRLLRDRDSAEEVSQVESTPDREITTQADTDQVPLTAGFPTIIVSLAAGLLCGVMLTYVIVRE